MADKVNLPIKTPASWPTTIAETGESEAFLVLKFAAAMVIV